MRRSRLGNLCGMLISVALISAFVGCDRNAAVTLDTTAASASETAVSSVETTPAPTSTPTPSPSPTPTPEPNRILVSFIGDLTLAEAKVWDGSPKGFDAVVNNDYEYCFKNARSVLSEDDMTLGNFEGTLTDATSYRVKEFVFGAPFEYVKMLEYGSIEAVNLANNHTDDYWDEGKNDTRETLDGAGILWSDETKCAVYDVKGVKIGMAGTTFPCNSQAMYNAIDKLRADGCQIVIISCHWGIERDYQPRADQVELGHALIDHGADIVIGTHPHRLQPIEKYNGHYILYCLSNFCFGGNTSLGDPDSAIIQCEFKMDPTNSHVENYKLNVIPYCQTTVWPGNDYCPKPYTWGSKEYYRVLERLNWHGEDE